MAQTDTQDFGSLLQTFMVDLDGDGVPDMQVRSPVLPPPPTAPVEKYGPSRSEFNPPLFSAPDEGDMFTLRYGGQRMGGIPNPFAMSLPSMDTVKTGAKNALMGGLEFAAAAGATGGPPGAIVGSAARTLKNLPAVAGDVGERIGRMFAGGRTAAGQAGDEVASAMTAPGEAVKGFKRGNVTSSDLMAGWGRSFDDGMGEPASYASGWQSTAYPPPMPPSRQITQGPSAPDGTILSFGQKHEVAGRRPPPDSFVKQGGGYVAESADPYMAGARSRGIARDELATDARIGKWNDARTSRTVQEGLDAHRPEAMADAVVNAYMPQGGFREMFSRDPMRVINDLETATGVSRVNLLSAMERAGFDLSFMTRDKFMAREGGRMSGYFAPGGKDAFRQVQESPILYRQVQQPARERKPGGKN